MLYVQTADTDSGSFLREFVKAGRMCLASARFGWHSGQTMGRLVDGDVVLDFSIEAALNEIQVAWRAQFAAGAYFKQGIRGWRPPLLPLTRNGGHSVERPKQRGHISMKGSFCRVCKKWCAECCKAVAARLRSLEQPSIGHLSFSLTRECSTPPISVTNRRTLDSSRCETLLGAVNKSCTLPFVL